MSQLILDYGLASSPAKSAANRYQKKHQQDNERALSQLHSHNYYNLREKLKVNANVDQHGAISQYSLSLNLRRLKTLLKTYSSKALILRKSLQIFTPYVKTLRLSAPVLTSTMRIYERNKVLAP